MNALKWMALWALALWAHAAQAGVDETSFLRCRGLQDASARLACYDALVWQPQLSAGAVPRADALTMPGQKLPVPAVALFGMEHQNDQQVKEISSQILGNFDGWGPRSKFRLENGHVWQISDDSSAVYNLRSPKVKISRAVLGGFEMEIEGAKRAPRVKRLE